MNTWALSTVKFRAERLLEVTHRPSSPSCRFGVALMESQLDSFHPCQDLVSRNQDTRLM